MGLIEWQYTTEGYVESLQGHASVVPLTRDELEAMEEEFQNGNDH